MSSDLTCPHINSTTLKSQRIVFPIETVEVAANQSETVTLNDPEYLKGNSHMISPDRTRLISILLSNSRLPGHLSPDLYGTRCLSY